MKWEYKIVEIQVPYKMPERDRHLRADAVRDFDEEGTWKRRAERAENAISSSRELNDLGAAEWEAIAAWSEKSSSFLLLRQSSNGSVRVRHRGVAGNSLGT
jgi:hypothetical protein